jgi:hypothetical protein
MTARPRARPRARPGSNWGGASCPDAAAATGHSARKAPAASARSVRRPFPAGRSEPCPRGRNGAERAADTSFRRTGWAWRHRAPGHPSAVPPRHRPNCSTARRSARNRP